LSETLAATITNCPECGGTHVNPHCWYVDEDKLSGCHVVCPATGASVPLTSLSPYSVVDGNEGRRAS
jgi:hypothetical protein